MIRRRFGRSVSREVEPDEDVNPNAYIVNIADCMLVLLLGMVVALVSYYNVDLTQPPEQEDEIIGIEVNMDKDQDGVIDPGYKRSGTVYYDEENDSYYFVNEK